MCKTSQKVQNLKYNADNFKRKMPKRCGCISSKQVQILLNATERCALWTKNSIFTFQLLMGFGWGSVLFHQYSFLCLLVCGGLMEIQTLARFFDKILRAHPHLSMEGFGAVLTQAPHINIPFFVCWYVEG